MTADESEAFAALGQRFLGAELSFRRDGTDWPAQWRARIVCAKNERDAYRITCYAESAGAAVRALLRDVAFVDAPEDVDDCAQFC